MRPAGVFLSPVGAITRVSAVEQQDEARFTDRWRPRDAPVPPDTRGKRAHENSGSRRPAKQGQARERSRPSDRSASMVCASTPAGGSTSRFRFASASRSSGDNSVQSWLRSLRVRLTAPSLAEQLSCARESAPRRPDLDAERTGDLFVGVTLDIVEHQHLAVVVAERVEHLRDIERRAGVASGEVRNRVRVDHQ